MPELGRAPVLLGMLHDNKMECVHMTHCLTSQLLWLQVGLFKCQKSFKHLMAFYNNKDEFLFSTTF